jgi:N-succinyldiaminopimelate aminotransferase
LSEERCARAIGPKTRAILINSPHNPAGRAFSREELESLAGVVRGTDIVVICDEVYEHLVYDGSRASLCHACRHARAAAVKIGSAGKIFSLTVGKSAGSADRANWSVW